jgi:hypothetical protein
MSCTGSDRTRLPLISANCFTRRDCRHWRRHRRRVRRAEDDRPVIEGFGLSSYGAHSNDAEYVKLESIVPRLYLSARMIMDVSQDKVKRDCSDGGEAADSAYSMECSSLQLRSCCR